MNDDFKLVIKDEKEHENSYVTVPIRRKDFGDFITNLLGQPETIEGKRSGHFDIAFDWLIHVHYLLDQRIKQQNHASLVDFTSTFKFKSGPDRKITSTDSFIHFAEAKKVRIKAVKVTWTYLVSFPQKKIPEKQEISITICPERTDVISFSGRIIKQEKTGHGMVAYTISHTERTWGDDIESLMSREIDSVIEKDKWYDDYITATLFLLAFSVFISGLMIPDYVEGLIRGSESLKLLHQMIPTGVDYKSLDIQDKLTLIISLIDPTHQLHRVGILYRIISFLFGVSASIVCFSLATKEKPSFFIVTDEDKKYKDCIIKKQSRSMLRRLLSFVIAIGAGIIGNYIYYYLSLK